MPAGTLSIDFIANTKGLLSGVRSVTGALGKFTLAGIAAGATMKTLDLAAGAVRATLSGIADMVKTGIGLAADAEQAQISFEVMLGSVSKAKAMLGEIRGFAAATPFESPELINAAKALLAMGINAKEVVPTLKMLGDVASGSGKPIGELAAIYGKVAVEGRVMNDRLNQFSDAGIPIFKALAKSMGVPLASIRKLAEQGKISFADLRNAMIDMTSAGGIYFEQTARQSQSLMGLWSTLKDSINLELMAIGESIAKNLDLKGVTTGFSEAIEALSGPLNKLIADAGSGFGDMTKQAGSFADLTLEGLKSVATALATVADWVKTIIDGYKSAQIGALHMAAGFARLWPTAGSRQAAHEHDLNAKELEDDLAKSNSKGSYASQAGAFFDKAIADLQNKRFLAAQQPKGPKGDDGKLKKVDPRQAAQQPKSLLQALFPTATAIGGLIGKAGKAAATASKTTRWEDLRDEMFHGKDSHRRSKMQKSVEHSPALLKGSSEAYSAILKAMTKRAPGEPGESNDPTVKAIDQWAKRFWDAWQKLDRPQPAKLI